MNLLIAELLFWSAILAMVVLVYQLAVLPGIRLSLRYTTFTLRDELRDLVIQGVVKESNPAFDLLHDRLTFMCASLSTYDLARLIQGMSRMDDKDRQRVEAALRVMEQAPPEIKKIYAESLHVYLKALIFNSLFFFAVATISVGIGTAIKVGMRQLKQTMLNRVQEDTKVGFVAPELAV
jgi:hypothetical protein